MKYSARTCLFRILEIFNKCCVAKEVARCCGQSSEQVVLKALEGYLEVILLLRKVKLKRTVGCLMPENSNNDSDRQIAHLVKNLSVDLQTIS